MDHAARPFRPNFLQKLANAFAAFSGIPFAGAFVALPFILSNPDSDELFDKIALILKIVTAVAIAAWAIVWHLKDIKSRKREIDFSNDTYWYFGQVLGKWVLAAILLFYAVSKLTGQQLTASNLWYGTELGRMNGFMLAWSFFGYSKVYSAFIALGQIAGALALLFKKTTRLGIIILLPILVNIFIMDFTFNGLEDARKIIPVLLYILVFLLLCEFKAFKSFFWDNSLINASDFASPALVGVKSKPLLKSLAFLLVIVFAVGWNYGMEIQQDHSRIDGVWYSRNEQLYDDSTRHFKLLDNNLEFFAEGNACVIKESGKDDFYQMKTDKIGIEISTMDPKPTATTKNIKGTYFLITKDSLEIVGRRGADSIWWAFKRRRS